MKRALITGHDGFVGRWLALRLHADGCDVWGFSRAGSQPVFAPAGQTPTTVPCGAVRGDIRRYEDIRRAVERLQPDVIFHLAAQAYVPEGNTDPRRAVDTNVTGTLNLLEAVRHTGCRARILLAGTSEEYGYSGSDGIERPKNKALTEISTPLPTTVYGVTKLAAGQLGMVYRQTYNMPITVTRAWNHTGPGHGSQYAISGFARKIAEIEAGKRDVLQHGNLNAVRAYLDVRDVVAAYAMLVQCDGGIYNVWADTAMTMREHLGLLTRMATTTIKLEADPGLYRPGMQRGEAEFPQGSGVKTKFHIGWAPAIPLTETYNDLLDYWRARV